MTDEDYSRFVRKYRQLRLGSLDYEFVLQWRVKLDDLDLGDLVAAVENLVADPHAGYPLNDLPLLLEHAEMVRRSRSPGWICPFKGQPVPERTTRWNQNLLRLGIITKAEFDQREHEKRLNGVTV